ASLAIVLLWPVRLRRSPHGRTRLALRVRAGQGRRRRIRQEAQGRHGESGAGAARVGRTPTLGLVLPAGLAERPAGVGAQHAGPGPREPAAAETLVFLKARGSRAQPPGSRPRRVGDEMRDSPPPLPPDQLAHALAGYRKLKQVKPDWVNSGITQMVMTELKRA